jgi:hypothetical protein
VALGVVGPGAPVVLLLAVARAARAGAALLAAVAAHWPDVAAVEGHVDEWIQRGRAVQRTAVRLAEHDPTSARWGLLAVEWWARANRGEADG